MLSVDTRTIWRTQVEARSLGPQRSEIPNPAAKFHQAAKEQVVFFDNLHHLSFDYRRKLLDLEEIDQKIADAEPGRLSSPPGD